MEDRLAIVGIAEVPSGWYPGEGCIDLGVRVIRDAVIDAGVGKRDIGALLFAPPLAQEKDEYHMTFCRLAEEMGLHGTCKVNMQVEGWWASPMMAITTARTLIRDGDAEYVVVCNSQNFSSCTDEDLWWFFQRNNLGYHREWERHFGISYKSMVGLVTQRYMHETGLTPEQLASVTVSLRKWASLNKSSRFTADLSLEEALGSEITSSPLHKAECGTLSDGATAFVLTSAKNAKSMKKPPVYILGEGHSGPPYFSMVQKPDRDFTRLGMCEAVSTALGKAGVKLKEVNLFELYAGFPIFIIMQLEEIGLCKRGEAGRFFADGHAAPEGKIPICTHGGIQQGDTGLGVAMTPFIEAVRQLRGEASQRQVRNARIALITNFGNQMMDSHVAVLGTAIK